MKKRKLENNTYDKFIDAMLELIDEKGGLARVNLRMVSKRIGCAHTNAYNYFDGYEGLIFEAYDKVLVIYGLNVIKGLHETKTVNDYFKQFVQNIINFALNYPGYYRFIGSDDFNIKELPTKTIQKAVELKQFFLDVVYSVTKPMLSREQSDVYANILMSYIDGELFNVINMRAFPDEHVADRILDNSEILIDMFKSRTSKDIPSEGVAAGGTAAIPSYLLMHMEEDL